MAFHLIVTCVAQKKSKKSHSILDPEICDGSLESVFEQWQNTLSKSSYRKVRAINLYKGGLWNSYRDVWGVINGRVQKSSFWILSAGYGLINSEDEIIPYDITFQEPREGVPSILAKVNQDKQNDARKKVIQEWWQLLARNQQKEPMSIESLVANSHDDDYFLFVLSRDYLEAVFKDLSNAIKNAKDPERIAVICNNVNDPLCKRLKANWLYADSRFLNLPKSNNTVVNAKIGKEILWHMFEEQGGLSWWSLKNFNTFLRKRSQELPDINKIERTPCTDTEVEKYIRDSLSQRDVPFSKLHRTLRNEGKACEYTRFRGIYQRVKNDLKEKNNSTRPLLTVHYEKRKTKMIFFLPDWDDRVDPLYDFINDRSVIHRDPYAHDAYHYELYGTLNCDGMLVSKSVLEDNLQKKEAAKREGIHKYLRLPNNVPVMGDCGAFSYITEKDPPYETEEILTYYEELGFTYGVSIDHLIVPGILKRERYFRETEGNYQEITKDTFKELEDGEDVKVIKSRKIRNQKSLFESKNLIVAEEYLDLDERRRRYELTINNAREFIEKHKKGRFSFIPIGAVQGWDKESYKDAVKDYQDMGYTYIAMGGLVRSTTKEILEILEHVDKVRKRETKLHVFGVARLDAIEAFVNLGVTSVDSAGMLRQAWLSATSNYYSPDFEHYAAIRIPFATNNRDSENFGEEIRLESDCIKMLRQFDRGEASQSEFIEVLKPYHEKKNLKSHFLEKYQRTLENKPWELCDCKICKEIGIDIIIFRGNNRNRRRGFHNTYVFFKEFKKITDLK